jgi:hypothetical protein
MLADPSTVGLVSPIPIPIAHSHHATLCGEEADRSRYCCAAT